MDRAAMVLAPTVFERAARTAPLRADDREDEDHRLLAPAGRAASPPRPPAMPRAATSTGWAGSARRRTIYSAEINHWLFDAALSRARTRRTSSVLYCHTTDYPMHMAPPRGGAVRAPPRRVGRPPRQMLDALPDLAIYVPRTTA